MKATSRSRWTTFDARDRGVLVLILVAIVLAAGYALLQPIWGWARSSPLRVPYYGNVEVPGLQATDVTATQASFDLVIPDPSGLQRVLDALPDLLTWGTALLALVLFYRVLGDIARGEPFAPRNVTRLRLIALAIAVGWSLAGAVQALVTLPILNAADLGNLPLVTSWTLPLIPLGLGMVIALIAEAFKAGTLMRDDLQGLI